MKEVRILISPQFLLDLMNLDGGQILAPLTGRGLVELTVAHEKFSSVPYSPLEPPLVEIDYTRHPDTSITWDWKVKS